MLGLVLADATAQAQTLGGAPAEDFSAVRVVLVLVLCLALAMAAAFALRHRFGSVFPSALGSSPRRLQLVERLRLSPQADLYLVRCDDRQLLLTMSAGKIISAVDHTSGMPQNLAGGEQQ